MGEHLASRVLLIGWDAADWKIIQPLLDAGQMPNLERLINEGVMGNLATLRPAVSPVLWTSIATGKRADKHGIHGFIEPRADGMGVQPVQSTSMRARPLWSILRDRGMKTAVVGWYATHPAHRAGADIAVSNLYSVAAGGAFDAWPLPPDCLAPESLGDTFRELRVHPADLDPQQLLYFVPKATEIGQEHDGRLGVLARLLAECASIHAAGTYIAEHESCDLLAVYYEMIDRTCHEFIPYRSPQMPGVSSDDIALYGNVVDNCYRFHDLMLGRYMQLVGPDTTIVVISDHGFYSDHLRPGHSPNAQKGTPLLWHRPHGIFVARGPGIKRDDLLFGASLLDVAPTLLTLLGVPVGRDMEGRVLRQIFDCPVSPDYVETHEPAVPLEEFVEDADPWAAQEAVKHLAALGYVEPPSDEVVQRIERAKETQAIILADVHFSKGNFSAAASLLEDVLSRQPGYLLVKLRLAHCLLRLGDAVRCRALVDELFATRQDSPWAHVVYGAISFAVGDLDEALARFETAEAGLPNRPQLRCRRGAVLLRQQRWERAEAAFREAIEIDGHLAPAYDGLGMALYGQHRNEEAVESCLRAIGLLYHQPHVHLRLGLALAAAGRLDDAIASLHRTIEMRPHLAAAHACLSTLYRAKGLPLESATHELAAKEAGRTGLRSAQASSA